jgi:hypothetical protein
VISIQQDGPDFVGNRTTARFTCQGGAKTMGGQTLSQQPDLSGFPAPFNPFKCNKIAQQNHLDPLSLIDGIFEIWDYRQKPLIYQPNSTDMSRDNPTTMKSAHD